MNIVGDTAGALWPHSELETTLAVASENVSRCAKSPPASALVRIEIKDSRFVGTQVASAADVDAACVNSALVGRHLYREKAEPPRDGALVLTLACKAP